MSLRVGTLDVVNVRLGTGAVSRVMLGDEQVWPSGAAPVIGTIAIVEAADVAVILGTSAPAATFVGTVVAVEADDVAAIAGTVSAPVYTGTIVALEADDLAAIVGTVEAPVFTGVIAALEQDDVAAIEGTVTAPVFTGAIVATETDDVAAIAGTSTPPTVTGTVAVVAASDVAAITGAFSVPSAFGDDFNRADGDLGTAWTHNTYVVSSNKAVKQSGNDFATFKTSVGSADMWVEADITLVIGEFAIVNLRHPSGDDQSNCYMGFYDTGSGGFWVIGKFVGGGYSDVARDANAPDSLTSFKLRLEAQGTTLRLYHDGSLVLTGTDSSLTTGTYAGINGNTTPTYDNFRCGPLPYTP